MYGSYKTESGWTAVKSTLVIIVVLLLCGNVGFAALRFIEKVRVTNAISELSILSTAIDRYFLDNRSYPDNDSGLAALVEKPSDLDIPTSWKGPYITEEKFLDPWGQEYLYQAPGRWGMPYSLSSLGSDGLEGGFESASDINSRDLNR